MLDFAMCGPLSMSSKYMFTKSYPVIYFGLNTLRTGDADLRF